MARRQGHVMQYERPRVPSGWEQEARRFAEQVTRVFDDIYAQLGRLRTMALEDEAGEGRAAVVALPPAVAVQEAQVSRVHELVEKAKVILAQMERDNRLEPLAQAAAQSAILEALADAILLIGDGMQQGYGPETAE